MWGGDQRGKQDQEGREGDQQRHADEGMGEATQRKDERRDRRIEDRACHEGCALFLKYILLIFSRCT
jgi:hypothetical protein